MTNLIAFTGYKQTGKTTAANHLIEHYGYMRHNFKDALVAEVKERFPDLLEEILFQEMSYHSLAQRETYIDSIDALLTTKPPLMRALLQNYGTEVRRRDNPNYWVHQWKYNLHRFPLERGVITDDVRFLNEAQAIKDLGGTIIRLTRPDITTGGEHSSETEMNQIESDYTIEVGPGEQDKLYAELDRIVAGGGVIK